MTTGSQKAVEVTNLTWTPFASSAPLLSNVSFSIARGERVLLVGPSGSGKSTLLRAIAGVLTETESGELTGLISAIGSGLLLQDPNDTLVSDTVYREVAFGLENQGASRNSMPTLVERALGSVSLDKSLEHPSTDLSGGEMQRMALAGVIAAGPELLLLDEPTSMLDAEAAASVRKAVEERLSSSDATLLVVEHRFAEWLPLVDRILVLNDRGELILDGKPASILVGNQALLEELGLWLPGLPTPRPIALDFGQFDSGSITVLTGKSGAGKTTELKRLLRNDPFAASIQLGAGYVPQQAELTILGSTVFESAHFTASRAAKSQGLDPLDAEAHTRVVLQALRVGHLVDKNPYEVSGGEQRRVALATALAQKPLSLYLDEPTVGQDREAWSAIVGAILAARMAGIRVTIATHDRDLIELADFVVQIEPTISAPEVTYESKVSGIAIFVAPIILLIGSMAVTSVSKGSIALGLIGAAAALLLAFGFRFRRPLAFLPGLVGVASIGFSNWYLSEGMNPATGVTAALRVAMFVLPGIALAVELKPVALGDQLGQVLRLPARPVVAATAAMQRMRSQLELWDELKFIHLLRGVSTSRWPLARARQFGQLVFAQLVQAIRSAGTIAVAMDARGFSRKSVAGKRTWAKAPVAGGLDVLVVTGALSISLAMLLIG
jgi:energy-coupling factor transport system permease/ATP-binding protein